MVVFDFRATHSRHTQHSTLPPSRFRFFGEACYSTYVWESVRPESYILSLTVATTHEDEVMSLLSGVYPATLYGEVPALLFVTLGPCRIVQKDDYPSVIQSMVDLGLSTIQPAMLKLFKCLDLAPHLRGLLNDQISQVPPSEHPSTPVGLNERASPELMNAVKCLRTMLHGEPHRIATPIDVNLGAIINASKVDSTKAGENINRAMGRASSWMARRIVSSMKDEGWVPEPAPNPPSGSPYKEFFKDVPSTPSEPDYKALAHGALEWLESGRFGGVKVSAAELMATLRKALAKSDDNWEDKTTPN